MAFMETTHIPQTGEAAPGFELLDSTGKTRRLSDLVSGGPCALVFYRGYW